VTSAGISADLSFEIHYGVGGEEVLVVPRTHSLFSGIMTTSNGMLFGKINQAKMGAIGAGFKTTLGIDPEEMNMEV